MVRLSPPFAVNAADNQITDDFFDDDDVDPPANDSRPLPSASWAALDNADRSLDNLLASIYARSQRRRTMAVGRGAPDPREAHNQIAERPNERDYPLWRVGCRVRSTCSFTLG